jgi:hypothetical protein
LNPFRPGTENPLKFGSENRLRFGIGIPRTVRRRADRAETTAAPASPARAAPPATIGTFAFFTTSVTRSAMLSELVAAVLCARLAALGFFELLVPVLFFERLEPAAFERPAPVVLFERLVLRPLGEEVDRPRVEERFLREVEPALLPARVPEPFRDVLLRARWDVDPFRLVLVLGWAIPLLLDPFLALHDYPRKRDVFRLQRVCFGAGVVPGTAGYPVDMKSLIIAATQRLSGHRPAALRALAGATVAGTATGVVVYKLLRQ